MHASTAVESGNKVLRFGSDKPRLQAPALIAIAVAVIAFLVWLIAGTPEINLLDILSWIAAGGFAAVSILFFGSWHRVVVDARTKQVNVQHGFLQYRWYWMGNQLKFSDITAVMVERKSNKETVAKSTSMSPGTRTVYHISYTLSLRRADTTITTPDRQIIVPHYAIELPMQEQKDPQVLESAARELALLGDWPARRRGYALSSGDGVEMKSVPPDAESPIDAD